MQKYHKNDLNENEPTLIAESTLSLNFADLDFPVNLEDELKERDWYIVTNIKTPLDYMDADLTEEEKMIEFQKNKAINGQLSATEELETLLNPTEEV